MLRYYAAATTLAVLFSSVRAQAEPILSAGYAIEVYANVPNPMDISFAGNGDLFVGRNGVYEGSASTPIRIHRVGAGGTPVVEYGVDLFRHPVGVRVDETGSFTGTAGSVLVVENNLSGGTGAIRSIAPDQTSSTLFGPSSSLINTQHLTFDNNGRPPCATTGS